MSPLKKIDKIFLKLNHAKGIRLGILLSSTLFGEICSVYPKFKIIVATGLPNPYVKLESGANLVLV
jgi:hypothetical protein